MTTKTYTGVALLTLLSLTACEHSGDGGESVSQTKPAEAPVMAVANDAESQIDTDDLLKYIKQLSSDEFEGRLPGTPGGEKTCLLYTSPSPRDRTRSRMPSSA